MQKCALNMPFFDCHNHLDANAPWQDWRHQGLDGAVVASAQKSDWARVIETTRRHSWLRFAIGVHPWHINGELEEVMAELANLLDSCTVSAIGEIGLDCRHVGCPDTTTQYNWCKRQCALAYERHLPVVLHICGDWAGLFRLLDDFPKLTGVIHSFGGNVQIARDILRRSALLLSFGPQSLHPDSKLPQTATGIPLERILVDSDAPYGKTPTEYVRDAATPMLCRDIMERLADARGISSETFGDAIAVNWRQLFANTSLEH